MGREKLPLTFYRPFMCLVVYWLFFYLFLLYLNLNIWGGLKRLPLASAVSQYRRIFWFSLISHCWKLRGGKQCNSQFWRDEIMTMLCTGTRSRGQIYFKWHDHRTWARKTLLRRPAPRTLLAMTISRFPSCVLLALSWNTNENPSTDKLSLATNFMSLHVCPSC